MNTIVKKYLESKRGAWAHSTLLSETSRLKAVVSFIDPAHPQKLWAHLQTKSPYTRLTAWTRVSDLFSWAIEEDLLSGPNSFKKFKRKNRRLFKNAYIRRYPVVTFEEAKERIQSLPNPAIRKRAMELLCSGARWSEGSRSNSGEKEVGGKSAKPRVIFKPEIEGPDYTGSYQSFYRALKGLDLRPHDLRKLAAARLVDKGVDIFSLTEFMGWQDVSTAQAYIRPRKAKAIAALLEEEAA